MGFHAHCGTTTITRPLTPLCAGDLDVFSSAQANAHTQAPFRVELPLRVWWRVRCSLEGGFLYSTTHEDFPMDPYKNAHNSVCAKRGPARLHQCVWCWGDADHWAYDHSDPDERTDRRRRYSLNVDHYRALCSRCHRSYDRLHREDAEPDRFEREFFKARTRYPRETIEAMAARRARRVQTFINGMRRTAPLTVTQTTIQRVMI